MLIFSEHPKLDKLEPKSNTEIHGDFTERYTEIFLDFFLRVSPGLLYESPCNIFLLAVQKTTA